MGIKRKRLSLEKLTAIILLCLMTASLLPVMYLGRYNHPTGDDYYYGADTKNVWDETGSTGQLLETAVRGVALQYKRWQGSYSAMLLMYLPPNLFHDQAYRFVTTVILLLLTGSIFYLLKPFVCTLCRGTGALWILLSSLIILLWVQTVPYQGESFFWYNGSMYYTGYYTITLFFFGVVTRYVLFVKKRYIPLVLFLAVFLAGGNYVSLLPTLILMIMLEIFMLFCAKSNQAKGIGVVCLVLLSCFLINALAPGNRVRQNGMWGIPAWKAVLKSLRQGIRYLIGWNNGWLFLALILITPFLWKTFSRMNFRFRYPATFLGLAYGVFCSMSCPVFYTMNSTGPARVVAIIYYSYILFVMVSYAYLLGYICQLRKRGTAISDNFFPSKRNGLTAAAATAFLLLAGIQAAKGLSGTTVGKAVSLLASGEAAAYENEYQQRLQILEDSRVQDVVFLPYKHQPEMLYVGDFDGNPEDETNRKVAQYFQKHSVCVKY